MRPERKIEVEWEGTASAALPVHLVVRTDDRPGLLNQITAILSNEGANIRSLEAKTEIDATRRRADRDDHRREGQEAVGEARIKFNATHLRTSVM